MSWPLALVVWCAVALVVSILVGRAGRYGETGEP